MKTTLLQQLGRLTNGLLSLCGLKLSSASHYISARHYVRESRRAGKPVWKYLEDTKAEQPGKQSLVGRRDRILAAAERGGALGDCRRVVEIGPGCGAFTDGVISACACTEYFIYEVDRGWRNYLANEFGVIPMPCDGSSLEGIADASIDLVQAHAVFVYIPLLTVFDYLKASARVLRDDGWILFNVFTERTMAAANVTAWQASPHRFPVLVPETTLLEYVDSLGFSVEQRFLEAYGEGVGDYFLLRRRPRQSA